MKKLLFLAPVLIVVSSVVAYYAYRGMMRRPAEQVVLPEFDELGPGVRAPASELLTLTVGSSTFDDVKALSERAGLDCRDTSARALMKQMRKAKAVDGVTSASSKKKSPMEQNPQIRWSCEGTKGDMLPDRKRGAGVGRILVVLDSPDHPVRHASFRRNHKDIGQALTDANATLAELTKRYGEPHVVRRPLPEVATAEAFPRYAQSRYEWRYADLAVMLHVMATRRGIDIQEAVEVPWPIRSDAPTLVAAAR